MSKHFERNYVCLALLHLHMYNELIVYVAHCYFPFHLSCYTFEFPYIMQFCCSMCSSTAKDSNVIEDACVAAAQSGRLHIQHWLKIPVPPCPWSLQIVNAAVKPGQIEVLQCIHSHTTFKAGWSGYDDYCIAAAEFGQLCVLQRLRSHDPPCPWCQSIHWLACKWRPGDAADQILLARGMRLYA